MKYIIGIFMVFMLSGCWQTVNETDLMRANFLCLKHGGISEVSSMFDGREFVTCKNGKVYNIEATLEKINARVD